MNISDKELENIIRQGIKRVPSENFTDRVMYNLELPPEKIHISPEYTFSKMLLPLMLIILIPLAGIYMLTSNPDILPSFIPGILTFPELKNVIGVLYQIAPVLLLSALSFIFWNLVGEILLLRRMRGKIKLI